MRRSVRVVDVYVRKSEEKCLCIHHFRGDSQSLAQCGEDIHVQIALTFYGIESPLSVLGWKERAASLFIVLKLVEITDEREDVQLGQSGKVRGKS